MFKGEITNIFPELWFNILPLDKYISIPISYLEIDPKNGFNLIGVYETYCKHPESKIYTLSSTDNLLSNINNLLGNESSKKITIINDRNYKFTDSSFDIIYVGSNLYPLLYLFDKLKNSGVMILDKNNCLDIKQI